MLVKQIGTLLITGFNLGNPWSFGPNALLSSNDRAFLWRMLECKSCQLRRIYHSLAARELVLTDPLQSTPIRPKRHFHQLARLIKSVLLAMELQKRQTFRNRNGFRIRDFSNGNKFPQMTRSWICNHHGTDLFKYMFYAADDECNLEIKQINATKPSNWSSVVFPIGQTELFDRGVSDFDRWSVWNDYKPIINMTLLTISLNNDPCCSDNKTKLSKINRRWSKAYCSKSPPQQNKYKKRVHFPEFSPVTSVHNLITYSTASQLVRSDRIWEILADSRVRFQKQDGSGAVCGISEFDDVPSDDVPSDDDRPSISLSCYTSTGNVIEVSIGSSVTGNVNISSPLPKPNDDTTNNISSSEVISCEIKMTHASCTPKKKRKRKRNRAWQPNKSPTCDLLSDLNCFDFSLPSFPTRLYPDSMCSTNKLLSHQLLHSFPIVAQCHYSASQLEETQTYF